MHISHTSLEGVACNWEVLMKKYTKVIYYTFMLKLVIFFCFCISQLFNNTFSDSVFVLRSHTA